jgi:hypothetical protein
VERIGLPLEAKSNGTAHKRKRTWRLAGARLPKEGRCLVAAWTVATRVDDPAIGGGHHEERHALESNLAGHLFDGNVQHGKSTPLKPFEKFGASWQIGGAIVDHQDFLLDSRNPCLAEQMTQDALGTAATAGEYMQRAPLSVAPVSGEPQDTATRRTEGLV